MATPVATVELVCRGYWAIRQLVDPHFVEAIGPIDRVGDHQRFQSLTAVATTVAAAGNLARFAATGENPLTLNYSTWLSLARRGVDSLGHRIQSPTAGLADLLETQTASLRYGWPMD